MTVILIPVETDWAEQHNTAEQRRSVPACGCPLQLNSVSCLCPHPPLSLSLYHPASTFSLFIYCVEDLKLQIDLWDWFATPAPLSSFFLSLCLCLKRLLINPATSSVTRKGKSELNRRTDGESNGGGGAKERWDASIIQVEVMWSFDKRSSVWFRMRKKAKFFFDGGKIMLMHAGERERVMKDAKDMGGRMRCLLSMLMLPACRAWGADLHFEIVGNVWKNRSYILESGWQQQACRGMVFVVAAMLNLWTTSHQCEPDRPIFLFFSFFFLMMMILYHCSKFSSSGWFWVVQKSLSLRASFEHLLMMWTWRHPEGCGRANVDQNWQGNTHSGCSSCDQGVCVCVFFFFPSLTPLKKSTCLRSNAQLVLRYKVPVETHAVYFSIRTFTLLVFGLAQGLKVKPPSRPLSIVANATVLRHTGVRQDEKCSTLWCSAACVWQVMWGHQRHRWCT